MLSKRPPATPPTNVRLERADGSVIPVELVYIGWRWRRHRWVAVRPAATGPDFRLRIDALPAKTKVRHCIANAYAPTWPARSVHQMPPLSPPARFVLNALGWAWVAVAAGWLLGLDIPRLVIATTGLLGVAAGIVLIHDNARRPRNPRRRRHLP